MFQIIKHIKNFKVSGEIYCNHYNSGLSLEAARQARRTIYHAGSEAWGPLHHLVHNPRKGRSSPEKLLLEHWRPVGPMLRAQSQKEGGSEWQPDPLKPALAIGWLSLGQIRFFGASVFLVCKREFMMVPLSGRYR